MSAPQEQYICYNIRSLCQCNIQHSDYINDDASDTGNATDDDDDGDDDHDDDVDDGDNGDDDEACIACSTLSMPSLSTPCISPKSFSRSWSVEAFTCSFLMSPKSVVST